jgi:hypothetical protein
MFNAEHFERRMRRELWLARLRRWWWTLPFFAASAVKLYLDLTAR